MRIHRLGRALKCAALAVALPVLPAAEAQASIVTFIHEGNGSGWLDGNRFSASDFVITALADTDHRDSSFRVHFIDHISVSILIEGVGDFDFLTATRTFVNNEHQRVGFSRARIGGGQDLFHGPTNAEFGAWDMLSLIGPISGEGRLLQWHRGIDTTGGIVLFDDADPLDATFTAVPEPTTLAIFMVGGICLLMRRRL